MGTGLIEVSMSMAGVKLPRQPRPVNAPANGDGPIPVPVIAVTGGGGAGKDAGIEKASEEGNYCRVDVNKQIRMVVKTGKGDFGMKTALSSFRQSKAKLEILAS